MNTPTIVQLKQLSKKYKGNSFFCLQDISFEIKRGEKFGILGPNGAGKTTLISMMCGIQEVDNGEINYFTESGNNRPCKNKHIIGYVPQDFAFYEELTALQNLAYFGAMYDLKSAKIKSKSEFLLNTLGLLSVANKKVKTYSGGMKRRLNLAIGLIHDPRIIFLDEPTVGVDIQSKNAIITYLNDLNKCGTTIVYTSHHTSEAQNLCTKLLILDKGKQVALDSTENILAQSNSGTLMEVLLNLTGSEFRDHA